MPNSVAQDAGIEVNDIIVSFNKREITSGSDLKQAMKDAPKGKSVPLLVIREDSARYITAFIPK